MPDMQWLTQLSLKRVMVRKENAPASVPDQGSLHSPALLLTGKTGHLFFLVSAMTSSLVTASLGLRRKCARQEERSYVWPALFMHPAT